MGTSDIPSFTTHPVLTRFNNMFHAEENVVNCHKQISAAQQTLLLKYALTDLF